MKMKKEKNKYIYCYNCGKKNKKNAKECVKCGTEFKSEKRFLKWLFGEEIGNFKGNVFGYICECSKEFIKRHLYGSVVGLALTFTIVSGVLYLNEKLNDTITTTNEEYKIEVENIEEPIEEMPVEETPEVTPEPEPTPTPTPTPRPSTPTPPSTPSRPVRYICPFGYELNGTKCYKYESINASIYYTCADGSTGTPEGVCEKFFYPGQHCADKDEYISKYSITDTIVSFEVNGPYEENGALKCKYEYTTNTGGRTSVDLALYDACPAGYESVSNLSCKMTSEPTGSYYDCRGLEYTILDGDKCKKQVDVIDATAN